jgi:hypothetical protein
LAGSIARLVAGGRLIFLLGAALVGLTAALGGQPRAANADCAFPFTPTTYEDLKSRALFLQTIELAAFDMLFPGDPYFGLPPLETGQRSGNRPKVPGKIPPSILKSISWIESATTQASGDTPFGAIGPSLVSFDCGHGIAQVTTGMTVPTGESGRGSPQQALVATHFAYNIARGAWILADKWNAAPELLPIAGVDTNSEPGLLENWYFALWAYNGFTGPGANRSNHPMDPIYGAWPRQPYSCADHSDGKGHNRGNYPYQELVIGCAANPPMVDKQPLWQAQEISLPNLNDPTWREPLKLTNFVFPYSKMDIASPQPFHVDQTARPDASLRSKVLGAPQMGLSKTKVKVGVATGSGSTVEIVDVTNSGTGVLAWYAVPSVPWLKVAPYTGVAVGDDLPCEKDVPCERVGHLEVSVDAASAPANARSAQITVQELGSTKTMVIDVEISRVVRVGIPGIMKEP